MAQLILLRHGESQWNLENRFTGWVDVPLSQKGIEEAKTAGDKLRGFKFDRAFTSVLTRANETLRIVLEVIGQTSVPIEKDKALERRFQPVLVDQPTVEETISILRGLRERYEVHHGVRIQDSALVAAATLSNSMMTVRALTPAS